MTDTHDNAELDKIFFQELRGKTVTDEQAHILEWMEKRLKPALTHWRDKAVREGERKTILRFQKIAQEQNDRGYDCHRILGEANIALRELSQENSNG